VSQTCVNVSKRLRQNTADVGQVQQHQWNAENGVHNRYDSRFGSRRSDVTVTDRRDDRERVQKSTEEVPLVTVACTRVSSIDGVLIKNKVKGEAEVTTTHLMRRSDRNHRQYTPPFV
jgi:NADH/NAD ratio-sensing transcriptional regulator Rex